MRNQDTYLKPNVDLTSCDKEAIHLVGEVQSYGAMIALSTDWHCVAMSENLKDFSENEEVGEQLGKNIQTILRDEALLAFKSKVVSLGTKDHIERIFNIQVFNSTDQHFDVSVHYSGQLLIIEFEKSKTVDLNSFLPELRSQMFVQNQCSSTKQFFDSAAQYIASITDFDRVMVYKFHPDDSGEVIAECVKPGVDSFLGLRYPASDIPKQARGLYLRNLTRVIADVHSDTIKIVPEDIANAIDLSMSSVRAVSAIHIEYLKNMGVDATCSISIIVDGALWGLFACHNNSPKRLSLTERAKCEVFSELFSLELNNRINKESNFDIEAAKSLHMRMMSTLDTQESLFYNLEKHLNAFYSLFPCATTVLVIGDDICSVGKSISNEDIKILVNYLNRNSLSDVFYTDNIGKLFDSEVTIQERFSGFLTIPISRRPRDYIIFLREEEIKSVKWAGNPDKVVEFGPNGSRLSPRKSFAAWEQIRAGYSAPWLPNEVGLAVQIKNVLLEVMIKNIDERERLAKDAQRRQDVLIHELNHRVRNILGLISSIISQTASHDNSVESFRDILNGRIQTIAEAQAVVSQNDWQPMPLRNIFTLSFAAYAPETQNIELNMPDCYLTPKAYTSMSLVVHELTTNALKYGALKHENAILSIDVKVNSNHNLEITWLEKGIVMEQFPRRRGFGSLIIERSIPYDLNGEVITDYGADYLKVTIQIPPSFFSSIEKATTTNKELMIDIEESVHKTREPSDMKVLLLEDNLIIALELQGLLEQIGFKDIVLASTVKTAEDSLDKNKYDMGVFDINLGTHTSFKVANHFKALKIPFLFVTGYANPLNRDDKIEDFDDIVTLPKPIKRETFLREIKSLIKIS